MKKVALLLLTSFLTAPAFADAPKDPLADLKKVQKINNDQAIIFFSSKIKKDPKDAMAYAKRGKAYSGNKEYDKALKDYEEAVKLDPKQTDAFVGLAVIYLVKKDYDKSWENVHKAEALGGQFWPAFMDSLKKESKRDK